MKLRRICKLLPIMLTLTLSLAMILPVPAVMAAEDNQLEAKNLDLQIWPEYDDPRVLAIFSGTLTNASDEDFSGRVYFNVPKDIEVQMACELVNGGQHSCQPYELENKGDYQVLSWKVTRTLAPGEDFPIWLEYYYNPLTGSPDKTMKLDYLPYYKTQSLKLTIKEPLKSSNFKIEPSPGSSNQDSEGFKNDFFNFENLDSNKLVSLNITYTRSEKEPSVKPLDPNAQQAAANDPLGTSAWKKPEVLIPVVLFIIILIIFIFYSFNSSKNVPPTDRIRRIQKKYGNSGGGSGKKSNKSSDKAEEKKVIRQMLLDGEISEETYRELMEDL
ncbi:MAG: hypothetical protein RO469_15460 [Thermincola sp.]|nr:hypothetical protein [Thermincola sp.]MDT3703846.1 hypothetical protein [Thermincola sp.]